MKTKIQNLFIALAIFGLVQYAEAQINYAISGNTAYVTNSPNASGNIIIASSYDGYPVTSIGDDAFDGCSSLTSVTIPDSVTSIGAGAFWDCSSLTSVTIGDGVINIGSDAFAYCYSLTSVTIPNSVTSIGADAFYGCSSLTSVTIGDGVINIGNGAFEGCYSLTSVTIPNSVTSIGGFAFWDCYALTSITIGDGVTSIGSDAFLECSSLTQVSFLGNAPMADSTIFIRAGNVTVYILPGTTGWSSTFANVPAIPAFDYIINDGSIIVTKYNVPSGTAIIPSSINGVPVTGIGSSAFQDSGITSITIPNSITNIGDYAFANCTNLTLLDFQGNAPGLGSNVFEGDTATVQFASGTTGWGTTFGGLPTVSLNPQLAISLVPQPVTNTAYAESILFDSFNASFGEFPGKLLQGQDGTLYGIGGGPAGDFVFNINTNGSGMNKILGLGYSEANSLIQGTDGFLYGTTLQGGVNDGGLGDGRLYKVNTNGSNFQVLYNFTGTNGDGAWPEDLIQGKDGILYGITDAGGAYTGNYYEAGTIFKIDTNGGNYAVLHSFDNTNGGAAYRIIQGRDGILYGTTDLGGSNNVGTIFKVSTNGTGFTVLHEFDSQEGNGFLPAIIQGQDNILYGTTGYGGSSNVGTVFSINTNGQNYQILYNFTGANGDGALAWTLLQANNGILCGTTFDGGSSQFGTIFAIETNGGNYRVIYKFQGSPNDGSEPVGLIQDNLENLFGTTLSGGGGPDAGGDGTIYELASSLTTNIVNVPLITVMGASNGVCQIEAAPNLLGEWINVTNLVLTNGQSQFIDLSAPNYPQRFYRVLLYQ